LETACPPGWRDLLAKESFPDAEDWLGGNPSEQVGIMENRVAPRIGMGVNGIAVCDGIFQVGADLPGTGYYRTGHYENGPRKVRCALFDFANEGDSRVLARSHRARFHKSTSPGSQPG